MKQIRWSFLIVLLAGAAIGAMAVIHYRMSGAGGSGDLRIRILKHERKLQVWRGATVLATYRIALGRKPVGTKLREGDMRTPEGAYYVCGKNPRSQFYRSLEISYPNGADADRGLKSGVITREAATQIKRAIRAHGEPPQHTAMGGEVFIHGGGTTRDWTWGCIALEDADMRWLYDHVDAGTPVIIEP